MWLPKPFPALNVYWTICFTKNQYKEVCKYLKIKKREIPEFVRTGCGACLHVFTMDHHVSMVICVNPHHVLNETRAIIVHEIVHCYQEIIENMNERYPGKEFMCYIIQNMTAEALNKYDEFLKVSE